MTACSEHVSEVLVLADRLIELADLRDGECSHDGCILLDGVLRDCAYKIRASAQGWRKELIEMPPRSTKEGVA
jgi:hypothetical protein